MSGINSLMELGKRALQSHQINLNVVGHNIANANRAEYTRQRVDYKASVPTQSPYGPIGTGVEVSSIVRQRERFIDFQLRQQYGTQGYSTRREQILSQVEKIFNEPSDSGLNQIMANFWDGWQELMNTPESTSVRAAVRQRANHMISQFQYLNDQMKGMRENLNDELLQSVTDINNMARQISRLNEQIKSPDAMTNDSLDERDKFLDEMAKMADITYVENADKTISVLIGGHTIVDGTHTHLIDVDSTMEDGIVIDSLVWENTDSKVNIQNGDLAGLLELRDTIIPDYIDRLDQLAVNIVDQVNTVHRSGYGLNGTTNNNFFLDTTTGADDIALSDDVLSDLDNIVAASIDSQGDNGIAEEIYNLRNTKIMADNTQTMEQFYNIMISDIGTISQESVFTSETQEIIINQMENQRSSSIGVSLDEEMVNLLKIQNAYQAASKVISTTNEMMNTVINLS